MLVIELLEASANFVFLENTHIMFDLGNIHNNETLLLSVFLILIAIGFILVASPVAFSNSRSRRLIEDRGFLVSLDGGSALVVLDDVIKDGVGNSSDSGDAIGYILAIKEELYVLHGVGFIIEELSGHAFVLWTKLSPSMLVQETASEIG